MGSSYVTATPVASAVPFDNSTNLFTSTNVQAAIEEVNAKINMSITVDQIVSVTKGGDDTAGTGSFGQPYLTIGKAISTIVDASPTKRYGILVGPGDYNENLVLKANIFIVGNDPILTRITGSTLNINDATWNVASADNRSGFQDISVNPVCTFDFSAQANNTDGKLYFFNVRNSGAWTCTANSSITQVIVQDSEFFGAITFNGCTALIEGSVFNGINVTVNSAATSGQGPAVITLASGRTSGNLSATWTSNGTVTLNLAGIAIGTTTTLTASGASCTVNVNDGSLPIPANRTFSSSAVLVRVNDNFAGGLLSATTNVSVSSATAPSAGQALIASSSTAASWSNVLSMLSSEATATATASTTSGTDALLTGMTLTPAAGTYLVLFSTSFSLNNFNGICSFSFYIGGSQRADSIRTIQPFDGGTLGGTTARGAAALQGVITVNGSQAIEVRWSTSAGTAIASQRTLSILRIG